MKLFIRLFYITILVIQAPLMQAQNSDANIFGDVQSEGEHIPFASVYLEGSTIGTATDHTGHYMLIDLPLGTHTFVATSMGYSTVKKEITITEHKVIEVNFVLEEVSMSINEVVVTGTKTFKRQTDAAVIVNVIDAELLNQLARSAYE